MARLWAFDWSERFSNEAPMSDTTIPPVSRRTFLNTTAAAAAAMAWPGSAHGFHIWGSDVIRVGVIGCGGRGTGAAGDCLRGAAGPGQGRAGDRQDPATLCPGPRRVDPACIW